MSEQNQAILAHQFDDLGQQHDTANLGMWVFLATELMFFGGLFVGFTVYRIFYLPAFAEGSHHLKMWFGAVNTGVLLGSSFTVALAVHAAQHGRNRQVLYLILATMALGALFLAIKATEYYIEYREGLVPGIRYTYTGRYSDALRLFLSFYFIMTAIHATHMIVGLGIWTVIAWWAWKKRFSAEYYNPVEVSGLYWHFVDIVWIFLFPLLYLLH